jgi:hypothetical protein
MSNYEANEDLTCIGNLMTEVKSLQKQLAELREKLRWIPVLIMAGIKIN